jgi:hypothetical protein
MTTFVDPFFLLYNKIDIAHIMRTQNQSFLALSNKVAALHETIQNERDHYEQYTKLIA